MMMTCVCVCTVYTLQPLVMPLKGVYEGPKVGIRSSWVYGSEVYIVRPLPFFAYS